MYLFYFILQTKRPLSVIELVAELVDQYGSVKKNLFLFVCLFSFFHFFIDLS
jgi:hypothetical protein